MQDGDDGREEDGVEEREVRVFNPEDTQLELNHSRMTNFDDLEPMVNLECLWMRNNLIKKIENLDRLTKLRELELYDNQITKLEVSGKRPQVPLVLKIALCLLYIIVCLFTY